MYVLFHVTPVILIKIISYLLLNPTLPLPPLLMSFSLMFGPHPFPLLMVFTTTLFLLTIIQSIYGFTRYVVNQIVHSTFVAFKQLVENYFTITIKTLYIDNGGKFLALQSFLATHGITHLTTPPHTLEHNEYYEC